MSNVILYGIPKFDLGNLKVRLNDDLQLVIGDVEVSTDDALAFRQVQYGERVLHGVVSGELFILLTHDSIHISGIKSVIFDAYKQIEPYLENKSGWTTNETRQLIRLVDDVKFITNPLNSRQRAVFSKMVDIATGDISFQ